MAHLQNINKIYCHLQDGKTIELNNVESLELTPIQPTFDIDYDYILRTRYSIEPIMLEGVAKLKINNDRKHKSKRYIKNRKGYRGFADIF